MNQKNGKNLLGLDAIFEDIDNPIELFKKWFSKAEETEINNEMPLLLQLQINIISLMLEWFFSKFK